jgi:mannose-6-phosphate isomerase-like protein (cupin superfamily)
MVGAYETWAEPLSGPLCFDKQGVRKASLRSGEPSRGSIHNSATENPLKAHTIIPVFGERIEILVSSEDSNYSLCAAVQTSPPGGGPPPHRHLREEETFMVLEGEYEFFDGESWTPMKPNEIRCSIRGHYHAFRNIGQTTGRLLFTTNGRGLDEYFAEISSLVLPQDIERLNEISKYYSYEFKAPDNREPSGDEQ